MSLLAHATLGALHLDPEKAALHSHIQAEIREARRIQRETGCSWSQALRQAYTPLHLPTRA